MAGAETVLADISGPAAREARRPPTALTLVFTDIEGSTRLLRLLGDGYPAALDAHRRLLRALVARHGGREVDTEGDGCFIVFPRADAAVSFAAAGQTALAGHPWPEGVALRVRIGIHAGCVSPHDGGYVGLDVHRAARICAAAHGGQVVLSGATADLLASGGTDDVTLEDLGSHQLKDLPESERLFQLVVAGLPSRFPPLRVQSDPTAVAGLPDYSQAPADIDCPYKGLVPFEPEDGRYFHGREKLIAELVRRCRETSLLAVIGPSGSGKSSLVRAGLVPAIRGGTPHCAAIFTPGSEPRAQLAAFFSSAAAVEGDGVRPMVVVDQFEELFTLCDDAERERFITAVLDATADASRVLIVLVLRADFYGHCALYPRLAAALERSQLLVGPMTQPELRHAIEDPASAVGLSLEPGLVDTILGDVAGEPGALPLLSHALRETWKRRSGRMLTLLGYLQTGGVAGALANSAETVFLRQLTAEQREVARGAFVRLSALGEGTEDTRRRVDRAELIRNAPEAPTVDAVVNTLVAARLLTVHDDSVEVAHEALIRHWPRLRGWLDEDRTGHHLHRHLTAAARDWLALGREPGSLYRGARLAGATEWAQAHEHQLNALEREFLAASRDRETAELIAARRRTRRLAVLAACLALLLGAAVAAGVLALRQRSEAIANERSARSGQLATLSEAQLPTDPPLSLGLALAAFDVKPAGQAQTALRRAALDDRLIARFQGHRGAIYNVSVSPDGIHAVTAGHDGTVRVWDLRDGTARILRGHRGEVFDAEFSRDGRRVVSAGADDRTVRVWDLRLGHAVVLRGHSAGVGAAAFSPDGRRVVSSGDDAVRVWDLDRRARDRVLRGAPGVGFSGATFSPDGTHVASAANSTSKRDSGGAVYVWDLARPERPRILRVPHSIGWVAYSPDGRRIAGADSLEGGVYVWTPASGGPPRRLAGARGTFTLGVAFSPGGDRVLGTGTDGTVRIWPLSGPSRDVVLPGQTTVENAQFTRDGQHVVSGSEDGTLSLWDLRRGPDTRLVRQGGLEDIALSPDGSEVVTAADDGAVRVWDLGRGGTAHVLRGHRGAVLSVAFSPDGRRVASGGHDDTIRIWDIGGGARPALVLRGPPDREFYRVAYGPDGRHVVGVSDPKTGLGTTPATGNGTVWIWDTARPDAPPLVLSGHHGVVAAAALSPRDDRAVSGGTDGTVRLWSLRRGARVVVLRGHRGAVLSVAFSPDGKNVASASDDATIRVWHVDHDGPPIVLRGHGDMVADVAFSPDGRWLVSAGHDDTLRAWDLRSPEARAHPLLLASGRRPFWRVGFGADGRRVMGATDRDVRLLTCTSCRPIGALVRDVRDRLRRVLTGDERSFIARSIQTGG